MLKHTSYSLLPNPYPPCCPIAPPIAHLSSLLAQSSPCCKSLLPSGGLIFPLCRPNPTAVGSILIHFGQFLLPQLAHSSPIWPNPSSLLAQSSPLLANPPVGPILPVGPIPPPLTQSSSLLVQSSSLLLNPSFVLLAQFSTHWLIPPPLYRPNLSSPLLTQSSFLLANPFPFRWPTPPTHCWSNPPPCWPIPPLLANPLVLPYVVFFHNPANPFG